MDLSDLTARYEAVIRGLGSGLIITGLLNKISFINDKACELTGWNQEEIVGKSFEEIFPIVTNDQGKSGFSQDGVLFQLANSAKGTVYYLTRKDGTNFPAGMTTSSIIVGGKVAGTAIVFSDITEKLSAEKAKSDFIAITSHQLRTPLGSMRWNLEMLLSGDYGQLPQEAKIAVDQVLENDMRMLEMVNNLLDVSRIDQGRVPNLPTSTDLGDAVRQVIKELDLTAKSKAINLIYESKTICPRVNIDPKRFRDVVENLISNAVKYTPEHGEVKVVVDGNEKEFNFSVSDTGMGIPLAEQERLFHRFFRAANAIKSQADGSGLGLYIVKSYVENWGGKVWFKSEEGKGTTFYFKIPVVLQ